MNGVQVTGFMSQGRGDGEEWVTSFMVSHSVDAFHWRYVTDVYANQQVSQQQQQPPLWLAAWRSG